MNILKQLCTIHAQIFVADFGKDAMLDSDQGVIQEQGYRRLRFFHGIRELEAANEYMLQLGRFDPLIETLARHCEVTQYKKGLFQLAYTLFSGIRNAHDASHNEFQNGAGGTLYRALRNPNVDTLECAKLLRGAFNAWKQIGYIKTREDIRPEWAHLQKLLKIFPAHFLWKKRANLNSPEKVHAMLHTLDNDIFPKLLGQVSVVMGADSDEYVAINSLHEKSKHAKFSEEDAEYFRLSSIIDIFERAWKKISALALASQGGYTDEELIKAQFRAYLKSDNEDALSKLFHKLSVKRESEKDRLERMKNEETTQRLLQTGTVPHWNFEERYEKFPADETIEISHGGGLFHLQSFFFGKAIGYKPDGEEGDAPCIYVAPPNYGGEGLRYYANRESQFNFDIPCILRARTQVKHLRHTTRHPDEALLMKSKVDTISEIQFTIL